MVDSRLIAINSLNDSLTIVANTQRQDLLADNMIDKLEVYASTGQKVKEYQLTHSYFDVDGSTISANFCDQYLSQAERGKRLRLDAVTEVSAITSESLPPHQFVYNAEKLPDLYSYARDHWGYYNGETSNATLVPSLWLSETVLAPGANRNAEESHTKAAVLEKIVYPTGGRGPV